MAKTAKAVAKMEMVRSRTRAGAHRRWSGFANITGALTLGVPAAPGSKNGQAAQLRTSLAEAKAAGPREPEDLASVPVPGAASNLPGEIQRLAQPSAMLYLRPLKKMGHVLQLQAFDAGYLEALRAGEPRIEEHFVCYFTELLQLKLRSRLRSPQAIEDVRQETFARVLATVRKKDGLRQPERLGPFVNTVCNNVLLEYYRQSSRSDSLDEDGAPELPARGGSVLDAVASKQTEAQVRDVLNGLPEHDRSLLKAVFLDERDRDDVCREFGVDRDYLRVLLHRAKHVFKAEYLKRSGNRLPFTSAAGEA